MNAKREREKKKSRAASIAIMLAFLFSIMSVLPFTAPVAMANPETVTLYFKPSDCSLVPKCECNTTYMELWANVTGTSTLNGGQVAIHYDQSCMNITQHPVQFNSAGWGPNISNSMSSWNANPDCYGYGYDMILFSFTATQSNTDAMIANFTVHCNTTNCEYCNTSLNFTCGRLGCSKCPIEIINASFANVYPADVNFINGTFECGKLWPDLIVERVDPQYIFANLTNKLFAKVTNIGGGPTVDTFNVSINITSDATGQSLYYNETTVDPLAAGASTDVKNLDVYLGAWKPGKVENITINVTADCDNDEVEKNESNNSLPVYRNTTSGDCVNDTMLPATCYGYRGDHPMSTVYEGGGSDVIYTVGDYRYKNTTVNFNVGAPGGDTNRITNTTADIPDGATIKRAALYVYHCWRDFDTYGYPDLGMEFTNSTDTYAVSEEANYTDWKGFSTKYTHYLFGTVVYNVTDYVTGNDTYTANITDLEWVPYQWMRGAVSGMALMVVYDDGSGDIKYKIAEGCDRLSTNYWGKGYLLPGNPKRWVYYVTPEDATTNATFPEVDQMEVLLKKAKLFTATIDGVHYDYGNGTKEALKFNAGPWYEGAWSNEGMGNYNYPIGFNRSNVTAYINDSGETAYFQERDDSYKNGFSAVFACLQTEEEPLKYVHPNSSFNPQDPIGSCWHELFPNFCTMSELTSWFDTNSDGEVSPCDIIDMTDELGEVSWYHVEKMPYTLNLTNEITGETMYIESEKEWQEINLGDPVCTLWHEVWPVFSNVYHLSSWDDNGNGVLDYCDYIELENLDTGAFTVWHVEGVEIDLILTSAPPTAMDISVEPSDVTVQPQDQFDVNITITGSKIYAVEYYLTYNTSVVRAETQNKGPFLGNYSETLVIINDIDQANGIVSYAETRTGPNGKSGTGVVATIQFTAIGERGAMSVLDLFDVIIVDKDKNPVVLFDTNDGTVTINDNIPPTARGLSKHEINNVAKKYPCNTIICSCSYDENYPGKGGNITYIRWAFGDGQYGTSEGLPDANNCTCKNHTYESWLWNTSIDDYDPFTVHLTVTDDGCPEETSTTDFDVTVYIAGDANGDGKVNIIDAAYVGMHWNDCCCAPSDPCPCYPDPCDTDVSECMEELWVVLQKDEADLNNDCNINILDAIIIGANWGHAAW